MKQFMSDSDSLKGDYIGFNSFVFLGVHSMFKCFIFQPYMAGTIWARHDGCMV